MSDFSQHGAICTLQRLNETHLPELEARLAEQARARPIALILPCHGPDFFQPAFGHLVQELHGARWLGEIIVSANGLGPAMLLRARELLAALPQPVRLLCTDGPSVAPILAELLGCGPAELPHGKGLNVWAAVGMVCAEGRSALAVMQDCDVASFRRETLARLCAAGVDPRLGFRLAKMYYSRVTDRLYGRVTRLFFAPLLRAVLRVSGHQPMLDFLLSFRYPLSGEVALECALASSLQFESGWGLETAMLCEAFRHAEPETVCQVDGGGGYDHRHQPLQPGGLASMCGEIARTLLAQLAKEGLAFDAPARAALIGAYRKEAALALRRSEALAIINGLPFDAPAELEIVKAFTQQLEAPLDPPRVLPAWRELLRHPAVPRLLAAG